MSIAELGTGRFGQLITRLLGIPGQSPVTEVGGTLDVGLTLENDRPEWLYLQGAGYFGGSVTTALGINASSWVRLLNPDDSGVLAVVEYIGVYNSPGIGAWEARLGKGGPDPVMNSRGPLDSRRFITAGVVAQSACVMGGAAPSAAAGLTFSYFLSTPGANRQMFMPPVVISPGYHLDINYVGTAGDAAISQFFWRERAAVAPYELA